MTTVLLTCATDSQNTVQVELKADELNPWQAEPITSPIYNIHPQYVDDPGMLLNVWLM